MSQFTLSEDQLKQLLQAAGSPSKPTVPTVNSPRVGGTNEVGAWVGLGAHQKGVHPKSSLCLRKFKTTELKGYQAVISIEEKCKAGLKSKDGLVFGLPGEPNHDKGALILKELDDFLAETGMESVFKIIDSNGSTVDMLKEPGYTTPDMVETWIKDLTTKGVVDTTDPTMQTRHAVCEYDIVNLDWSGQAVLNSCSTMLKQEIQDTLDASQLTGPQVLNTVCKIVYPSSYTKVTALKAKLEALDLRKIPGENISTLVLEASQLIREIKMNYLRKDQIPDLTISALKCFNTTSHPFIKHEVTGLMLKANNEIRSPNSSGATDTLAVLQNLKETYLLLVEQDDYAPGKQPTPADNKVKAMQGEIKRMKQEMTKLQQDREATSTKGNNSSNGGGGGSSKEVKCFECGGSHYKSQCPKLQGNNDSNSSNNSEKQQPKPNGLGAELNKKITAACKEKFKTMPKRADITKDAQYKITIDGKDVAKYCKVCGRFVRGDNAHFTTEHKRPKKPEDTPRAGGNMAAVTPPSSPPPSQEADREPTGPANSHLIKCSPHTYFDFSAMPVVDRPHNGDPPAAAGGKLAANNATTNASDDDSCAPGWLHAISKGYAG